MNQYRQALILPAILAGLWALILLPMAQAEELPTVFAAVIRVDNPNRPQPISRLDLAPDDLGFAGGDLATSDNLTTGRFLGQDYKTLNIAATPETAQQALEQALAAGVKFIVVLASADIVLELANAAGERALVMNAQAPDDSLRNDNCRANLVHIAPSRAMLSDALAQFLMWKKWNRWFLVEGSHPEDKALGDAYRRAAHKFGAKIVDERVFTDTGGARRTDTGYVQVQRQMPVFTQRAGKYDILIAADEAGVFAAYLPYQTWDARPVAGSAGLRPTTWDPSLEAWGATQFQRRFEKLSGRYMRVEDYLVWLALRVLSEAATRTQSVDHQELLKYMLSPDFELAAFKGEKVSFRPWNGQLRQPILLTNGHIMVSVSPQDEYLHRLTQLDTLGIDEPESTCTGFR